MTPFLVFRLEAPLAAMGELAVGERRYGSDRPAKSAVLGLVAAGLGIERADEVAHRALADGYRMAVRVDRPGRLLTDYHTVQVPPARKGKRWATRRQELAEPELETILSYRDYRSDVCHTIVIWANAAAPHTLERLAEALKQPHFMLYFGRKACPLGRPPTPKVVATATVDQALQHFDTTDPLPDGRREGPDPAPLYGDLELADLLAEVPNQQRIVQRRDVVSNRDRWQFTTRDELVVALGRSEGGT